MADSTGAPGFDLINAAWVTVADADNAVRDVSLRDALVRSHEFRRLGGEVPTQAVAVLRLLLAVLRRAYPGGRTPDDWAVLWGNGRFDAAVIDDYLGRHAERFDLLHPELPFFQVAGLHTAKDEMTELTRLIADVPAGHRYFTTRTGRETGSMSYAEAARWLVHAHSFDPSGIKSGAVGDDRVKGGKGYPIGTAWCGWLGLVIVEGANLFETLMLNLPFDPSWTEDDLPVWERPPQGPGVEVRPQAPTGPVDLLTWQSRRICLGHDGERVTGVLIANGDPLHPRNLFRAETMTSWRRSEAQEKAQKSADPIFMPREHLPERAVWRGLAGLLTGTDRGAVTQSGRWLEWLAELEEDILPSSYPLQLRAVGVHYGAQSSVIDDLTDDVLPLNLAVLSDPRLKALAINGVDDVDAAVRALGQFADELARASGADRELRGSHRAEAREQGYAALDAPYRGWVRTLSVDTDRGAAREAWQRRVRREVIAVMRQLLDSVSAAAWPGVLIDNDVRRPLNAATATNWFYLNLAKALPLTRQPAEGATS
ncbi:type I-E CRISPR-associated protein Cse1/CasA [Nocardioides carbamazepini]|uniref:type I-E CRISPR-associated protein Cse1/CasA n=1 Tax=Nocardioides carbamazepini TaxID=2854259 RepID=UPI00214A5091|nr:type I-E CRISPR-associated protein Cse1/CasA [Nocardioides carbamazepini]MCR1781135.1 type I-E CRISPR-associated protein Cse1/CasA [Nocardioides carbamazepini]